MWRILVVDDEVNIRKVIREYCEFQGYQVTEAADGMEAVQLCREQDFDAVILDVMLPRLDGFTACKEIKKGKDIPIIMLSARGEEYDKLFGFEMGIDDYMVKPFSPMELMARLKVVLRRSNKSSGAKQKDDSYFSYQGLELDLGSHRLLVDGTEVNLAPKDYELLSYLVKNRGKALSRETLLSDVWGYDFFGNDRTIDSHVKILRSSLGPYRDLIVTLRSMGYKFEVPNT